MKNESVSESYEFQHKYIDDYYFRGQRVDLYLLKEGTSFSKFPRSQHQWNMSSDFKNQDIQTWTEWSRENLVHMQNVLIERYFELGFCLLASPRRTKKLWDERIDRPESEYRLGKREAMRWCGGGGNLAILCGRHSHGVIAIDIDGNYLPRELYELSKKTLTTKSIHGFHEYYRIVKEGLPKKFTDLLKKKYECVDSVRGEGLIAILPLSIHKTCPKNAYAYQLTKYAYKFLDWKAPILDVKELLNVM